MRLITYSAIVVILSSYVLYAQSGNSSTPAAQPSPTPIATSSEPVKPGSPEMRRLEEVGRQSVSPHTADEPGPPTHVMYSFFFQNLALLEALAAAKEAKGEDGSGWRTHTLRVAGLSDSEAATVKLVAFDCNKQVDEQDKKIGAAIKAFRQQYPRQQYPTLQSPEVNALWAGRLDIINSHIQQLQLLLGPARFQTLDQYVQGHFRPVKMSLPIPTQTSTPAKEAGPQQ
jgi:hypothetical protein